MMTRPVVHKIRNTHLLLAPLAGRAAHDERTAHLAETCANLTGLEAAEGSWRSN